MRGKSTSLASMTNVTYTFPVGGQQFAEKAVYLLKSMINNITDPDIVTYITPEEVRTLHDDYIKFFDQNTHLIIGPRPIDDYPISAKLAAFRAGANHSQREFIVHLDSDTLLMSDLSLSNKEKHDVYLKPPDMVLRRWEDVNQEDWVSIYKELDVVFPGYTMTSDICQQDTPPFYNAGVVVTRDRDFPDDWINMTRIVHERFPYQRFSDQVALGILSREYDVGDLTQKDSFIVDGHYWCPSDIRIMRYQDYINFCTILNPFIWIKMLDIDINPIDILRNEEKASRKVLGRFLRVAGYRNQYLIPYLEKLGVM